MENQPINPPLSLRVGEALDALFARRRFLYKRNRIHRDLKHFPTNNVPPPRGDLFADLSDQIPEEYIIRALLGSNRAGR